MKLINYGDKKVYCTGAKLCFKDEIALFKGVGTPEFILSSEITEDIENIIKRTKHKDYINISDIVDLFCYGDIVKNNDILISDWSEKFNISALSSVAVAKDCYNKFGACYAKNLNITLLPSVRLVKPDLITFGLYSPDTNEAVVEAYIWDISNNGTTDKEKYYTDKILNKLKQLIK